MTEIWAYIICVTICSLIWIINGRWLIHAVRKHVVSEIYIHTGLGIFFTLLVIELTLGNTVTLKLFDIFLIRVIGFILYIPSAYLVAASMHALKHKGKPKAKDPTATTTFLDSGIYSIIRQPMTLGMSIWSVALIMVFQSILSMTLGTLSILCFWTSARKEAVYNIKKFGKLYKDYMEKVPMWNFFKVLIRSKKR